jgi:hypothetical protein
MMKLFQVDNFKRDGHICDEKLDAKTIGLFCFSLNNVLGLYASSTCEDMSS